MLEDEVEGHVYCIIYRPVGSVGEPQWIQEWVCDGFGQHKALKFLNYHRGQGDRSVVIKYSPMVPVFWGDRDDDGCLEAGWHMACLQ